MLKKNNITIGDALKEMLDEYQLTTKLDEVNLVNSWGKVVGKMIDNHTTKIWINHGVLYVGLDSAALKQELTYSKSTLIKSLNDYVKKELVQDIVFK